MTDPRSAYASAAASFVAQVAHIERSALDGPGLGDWDLRSLVGHTSRSLTTVETYLRQPAEQVVVPTAADYYLAIASTLRAGSDAIVERGREAGRALGADPATFVRDLAGRVAAMLPEFAPTFTLTTIAGGMPLDEYLRTRTFELVVHGLDIADASGVDPAFAEEALVDAATLAAEVGARAGRGPDLLLAVTGRRRLPAGFSIV